MDEIKMTVDEIRKAMHLHLFSGCAPDSSLDVEFVTEEDDARREAIMERIEKCMALDENFKVQLENDIDMTLLFACSNSFDIGFNLGVSILKCLLNAEVPTVQVLHRQAKQFEREKPVLSRKSSVDEQLVDYLKESLPNLTERQKLKLQGKIEYIVEENTNAVDNLF